MHNIKIVNTSHAYGINKYINTKRVITPEDDPLMG
jgi:hypothetical protein